MTARRGTRQIVLLGAGMGVVLLLVEVGGSRLGLGGATTLVNLVPIALGLAVSGWVAAGVAGVVAIVGAGVLLDGSAAVVVALRYVLPGVALGLCAARRLSLPVSLMMVGAASLVGLTLVVWAYVPVGTTAVSLVGRQLEAHVADLERWTGTLGIARDPAWVSESTRLLARTLRVAGPAIIVVGLLFAALTNYAAMRLLMRGHGFRPFADEAVPDHLVWGVIAGGLMLVSNQAAIELVGVNLLIVLASLYAIQGLAVVRHFFQKARVPRPLQGVSFGLFAVQPLLLIAAACLGLSDLWVDFRKIRRAATPA